MQPIQRLLDNVLDITEAELDAMIEKDGGEVNDMVLAE